MYLKDCLCWRSKKARNAEKQNSKEAEIREAIKQGKQRSKEAGKSREARSREAEKQKSWRSRQAKQQGNRNPRKTQNGKIIPKMKNPPPYCLHFLTVFGFSFGNSLAPRYAKSLLTLRLLREELSCRLLKCPSRLPHSRTYHDLSVLGVKVLRIHILPL